MDGRVLFQRKEIIAQAAQHCYEMRHALICCGCGYRFGSCYADVLLTFDSGPILDYGSVVLRSGFRKNAAGIFVRSRSPRRLPGLVIDNGTEAQPHTLLPSETGGASGYALDVSRLPISIQCPRCRRRNIIPPFNIWRNPRTGEVGI